MNTKTTAVVVVIAVLLGAYFLIFERDLLQRRPAQEEPGVSTSEVSGRPILGEGKLSAEKIQRIRIERPDQPTIVIERADKGWRQAEPVRFPLQSWDIDRIVSDAVELRYSSKFTPASKDLKLDQLGLDPAAATLTFESEGAKATTLFLGRRGAAGGAYLALDKPSAGGEVYVVGDALHTSVLAKDPREWRSRTLPAVNPGSVERIVLQRDGESVEITHSDGRWVLQSPVTGRADRDAAQQLARVLGETRIAQFVKDNPTDLSAYGLAEPQVTLTISSASDDAPRATRDGQTPEAIQTTHTLKIGGPATLAEDNYFAMWNDVPVVFTIAKADLQKLQKPVNELRDPRLTPADRTAVREVLLRQRGDQVLHFVKDAGDWKFGDSAPPYDLDSGQVDLLLKSLFDTKATDYVTLDRTGMGEPLATVHLAITGNEQGERLAFYEGPEQTLICVRGNESIGYVVNAQALEPIFQPALAYRDRTVFDLEWEDLTGLRLTRTGEHPAQYSMSRDESGQWNLEGYDRRAFQALLDRVAPLLAERWLIDPPGTNPEGVTVELTLMKGEPRAFQFDPTSRIAVAQGVEGIFMVDEDLAKAATAELRDRVVLKADLDQIATVRFGGATIHRDGNGLYKVEDGEGLDEQKAARIYDELAGLTARRYLPGESIGQLGEPPHRLTVITRDDEKYELSLWPPQATDGRGWIGRIGEGQPFTLEEATAQKLLGQGPSPDRTEK